MTSIIAFEFRTFCGFVAAMLLVGCIEAMAEVVADVSQLDADNLVVAQEQALVQRTVLWTMEHFLWNIKIQIYKYKILY